MAWHWIKPTSAPFPALCRTWVLGKMKRGLSVVSVLASVMGVSSPDYTPILPSPICAVGEGSEVWIGDWAGHWIPAVHAGSEILSLCTSACLPQLAWPSPEPAAPKEGGSVVINTWEQDSASKYQNSSGDQWPAISAGKKLVRLPQVG